MISIVILALGLVVVSFLTSRSIKNLQEQIKKVRNNSESCDIATFRRDNLRQSLTREIDQLRAYGNQRDTEYFKLYQRMVSLEEHFGLTYHEESKRDPIHTRKGDDGEA